MSHRIERDEQLHEARTLVRRLRGLLRRDAEPVRLDDGLGDTYRWGRRAMATAYHHKQDAAFHEWRKAIKYHGYHVRLLADVWPEEMAGRLEVLERLGSLLGEDHGLAEFACTLADGPADVDSRSDRQVLLVQIAQRQQALRALARPLGRRLFAEPPSAFKRRLHQYWKLWRDRANGRPAVH